MSLINDEQSKTDRLPKRRPSLVINAISNWAALGVNVGISFVLTPYLIHNLGQTDFGVWKLLASVVGMYGLLDLGISSAIMRYISYYLGRKDYDSLNSTFNTSLALFCVAGLLCILLAIAFVRPLAAFFSIPSVNFAKFRYGMWFLGLATALAFFKNVITTTIRAYEFFVPYNIILIVVELTRGGLCVLLVGIGWGLQGAALATLVSTVVSVLCYSVLFKCLCPDIKFSFGMVDWKSARRLLVYGVPVMVTVVAEIFRTKLDSIVIAKWLDMRSVTLYMVGATLVLFLQQLLMATSGALDPRFGRLSGIGDRDGIANLYLRSLAFTTSLAFSVGITMLWIGRVLISLWIGAGYDSSYTVFSILVIGHMCAASQMPTISLLFALNRHRICAVLVLVEGLANLTLSILFVQKWGIYGVAMGTLIPMVVCKIFILPVYAIRLVDVRFFRFYWTITRPIVVLTLIGLAIVRLFHPVGLSWFQLIGMFCMCWLVLMCTANWLGQSSEHRFTLDTVRQFVLKYVSKVRHSG